MTRLSTPISIQPALKRLAVVVLDGGLALASAVAALSNGSVSPGHWIRDGAAIVAAVLTVLSYQVWGLYRGIVSQMTGDDLRRLSAAACSAGLLLAAFLVVTVPSTPVVPATLGFTVLLIVSTGLARAAGYAWSWRRAREGRARVRVAIYGAGQAGVQLAAALERSAEFQAVAFFDDDPALQGRRVRSLPVINPRNMQSTFASLACKRVLLAIPSASRQRRREIVQALEALSLEVNTVPDLEDIATGRARVSDLRAVDIVELLEREPVPPMPQLLGACIAGKNVMVTGAGGSIGSELCRQILSCRPRTLVLYEFSEPALYQIGEELEPGAGRLGAKLISVLGSTQDRSRLDRVCIDHAVQTIYHVAAYKHVPLLETNSAEGVRNNVVSTRNVVEAAVDNGVEVMVLISSDKAVRPTSVMGASKRFCELIVQAMAGRVARTAGRGAGPRFCMVRFGNVLGSSGSVVPKFRAQIAVGGPVTVTHPEVVRYFMTIPEAAQLVLQAGALAGSGDIFVLDMGQPVKIIELARRMVHLSGLSVRDERTPEGDIAIEFTGLRPGEKLYEELLIDSKVERTDHPRISRATEPGLSWAEVSALYDKLMAAVEAHDEAGVRAVLQQAVRPFGSCMEDEGATSLDPPPRGRKASAADCLIINEADIHLSRKHHGT